MLYNYGNNSSSAYILNIDGIFALSYNLHEDSDLLDALFNPNKEQASSFISIKGVPFDLVGNIHNLDASKVHTFSGLYKYMIKSNITYKSLGSVPLQVQGPGSSGQIVNEKAAYIVDIFNDVPLYTFTFYKNKIDEMFKNNYLDYSSYSNYTIYLPCIGYRNIDYSYLKNSTQIQVKYYFDYFSCGLACNVIAIMDNINHTIMQEYCDVGYDLPITYNDGTSRVRAAMNLAGAIFDFGLSAAGLPTYTTKSFSENVTSKSHTIDKRKKNKKTNRLNTVADTKDFLNASSTRSAEFSSTPNPLYKVDDVINGISNLYNARTDISIRGSYNSFNASNLVYNKPVLIYSHPEIYDESFSSLLGRPTYKVRKIGAFKGYTKISTVHLNIPCLSDEMEEIEQLLKDGVILNTNVEIPDTPIVNPTPEPDLPVEDDPIKPNLPPLPEGETATMLCCFNGKFRVSGMRGKPSDTGRPRNHYGLDLVGLVSDENNQVTVYQKVYAISSGWVKLTDEGENGLGKCVHVQMDNQNYYGEWILYGHLSKFEVKNGQYVEKGQLIGLMGDTGSSKGWHTHLEWRNKYDKYDPDFSKYDICKFTGIPNTSVEGQNVHIGSPVYKTANGASVQSKLELENQTIEYLENYKYADDLMKKIDDHTK